MAYTYGKYTRLERLKLWLSSHPGVGVLTGLLIVLSLLAVGVYGIYLIDQDTNHGKYVVMQGETRWTYDGRSPSRDFEGNLSFTAGNRKITIPPPYSWERVE